MGDARPLFERWAAFFDEASGDVCCAFSAHSSAESAIEEDKVETTYKDGWRPSDAPQKRVKKFEKTMKILCSAMEVECMEIARQAYKEAAEQGRKPHEELYSNKTMYFRPNQPVECLKIEFIITDGGAIIVEE